ncbi:hypothetical protein A3K69_01155 [Candidatus Bathyarchaeota archaeon RBG_16_57_9]|nr:MAG: hypothetical protein A3K69_01155 [Candidatus Bathyarchaeota archaeon RBG_16_57_9]
MRTDEKIQAAVIAGLLAYTVLILAPLILGDGAVEHFSELGVLGPHMRLDDYPREAEAGRALSLYLYLGNHEGQTTYYRVLAKLGDRSVNVTEGEPYPSEILSMYRCILMDETNITRPIAISIREAGLNRRLVFELQKYDPVGRRFVYDGVWVQLWLNVTEPS